MEHNNVPVSLLPEIYQDIVRTVGLDAALELGREFGGTCPR